MNPSIMPSMCKLSMKVARYHSSALAHTSFALLVPVRVPEVQVNAPSLIVCAMMWTTRDTKWFLDPNRLHSNAMRCMQARWSA